MVLAVAEPGIDPLVYFRADALDEPFGHGILVTRTEIGVRGHRRTDLRLVVAAHERTLQPAGDRHKCRYLWRA
jgi:hypothetical protein